MCKADVRTHVVRFRKAVLFEYSLKILRNLNTYRKWVDCFTLFYMFCRHGWIFGSNENSCKTGTNTSLLMSPIHCSRFLCCFLVQTHNPVVSACPRQQAGASASTPVSHAFFTLPTIPFFPFLLQAFRLYAFRWFYIYLFKFPFSCQRFPLQSQNKSWCGKGQFCFLTVQSSLGPGLGSPPAAGMQIMEAHWFLFI